MDISVFLGCERENHWVTYIIACPDRVSFENPPACSVCFEAQKLSTEEALQGLFMQFTQ